MISIKFIIVSNFSEIVDICAILVLIRMIIFTFIQMLEKVRKNNKQFVRPRLLRKDIILGACELELELSSENNRTFVQRLTFPSYYQDVNSCNKLTSTDLYIAGSCVWLIGH